MKTKLQALILILISFAIGYYSTNYFKKLSSKKIEQDFSLNSSLVLTNQYGEKTDLLQTSDKLKIVYFGFTHCPDVCPGTLATFSAILKSDESFSKKAGFYFVTVDPDRDSPDTLKTYLNNFNSNIIGLTGDRIDIEKARKAFQAEAKMVRLKNNDYTVDHSIFIYILNKENKVSAVYPSGISSDVLAKEIAKYF